MSGKPVLPATRATPARRPIVVSSEEPGAVITLQRRLVERAVELGASDLHVEPRPDRVRVRVRVDGRLRDLDSLPRWLHPGLVARFKVVADMDVTEKRRPQDGRATVDDRSPRIDLRIATLPTRHGEKVVVRLLPQERHPPSLGGLGLSGQEREILRAFVDEPQGLILAAGPTGSGKTTTLYALLRRIDSGSLHVVTLEDPIEYSLPGIVQVPVRARLGVDFAASLRAVLRQDPDVILLGEIRDEESARVAVRAAVTGHLVLSTVHTNSAIESAHRLIDLGVPRYLLAAALIGVVSQRLVRRLCTACRHPGPPDAAALAALGLRADDDRAAMAPTGCELCGGGFSGRIGLFETLVPDDGFRRDLAEGRLDALEPLALERGLLRPLYRSARAAVRAGVTTASEAARLARCPHGADTS